MAGVPMTPWTFAIYWKTLMQRAAFWVVLVPAAAATGWAQQSHSVEFSVGSGYAIPVAPMAFESYWQMQYGAEIRAGFPLSKSLTLVGGVEYDRFELDEAGVLEGYDTDYMRTIWAFDQVSVLPSADPSTVTTVSANLRIAPPDLSGFLSPYFIGGGGVMWFNLSEVNLQTTSVLSVNGSTIAMTAQQSVTGGENVSLFVQVGLGFKARLSESFGAYIEARYVNGLSESSGAAYAPFTIGVQYRL